MFAFGRALKSGPAIEDASRWLRQAFLMETNNADTHPCLKDRLRGIGRLPAGVERGDFPVAPPPAAHNAGDYFLGSHLEVAERQMSDEWKDAIASEWVARHERTKKLTDELVRLNKPSDSSPSAEQLLDQAETLAENDNVRFHVQVARLPVQWPLGRHTFCDVWQQRCLTPAMGISPRRRTCRPF